MRKIDKIVVHHSYTPTSVWLDNSVKSFDKTHFERWLHVEKDSLWYYVAYHFVVLDDKFVQTRALNENWRHASDYNVNISSIWICVVWDYDSEIPSDKSYETVRNIINSLRWKSGEWFEISKDLTIHRHGEYVPWKSCPGKNFVLDLLKIIMSKYEKVFKQEVSDPIFTQHEWDAPLSEKDVKFLIDIAFNRGRKKLIEDLKQIIAEAKANK